MCSVRFSDYESKLKFFCALSNSLKVVAKGQQLDLKFVLRYFMNRTKCYIGSSQRADKHDMNEIPLPNCLMPKNKLYNRCKFPIINQKLKTNISPIFKENLIVTFGLMMIPA